MRSGSETLDADYEALRRGAGMAGPGAGAGRDVLHVMGRDALSYLQGQCTQDLTRLGDGESADALLLSPQGKLDVLVRVTLIASDELVVDVQAGYGEAVKDRLDRFKLRVKAVVEQLPWSCVSVRGPRAREAIGHAGSLAVPFEWNGVVGVDVLGEEPGPTPSKSLRICGPDAWEAVRVEAGIPAMGSELDARTIPAEAGLLERCVSMTKGCYTGQELVARLEARGNRVARRLRGLVVAPEADEAAAKVSEGPEGLRGSQLIAGSKAVGTVTSSAWSPALGTVVGLGYVHRDVPAPGGAVEIVLPCAGGEGARLRAEVRDLPLV